MRKYYYFCYQTDKGFGDGMIQTDGVGFPLSTIVSKLHKQTGKIPTISNWKEISHDEYVKTQKLYEELGNKMIEC